MQHKANVIYHTVLRYKTNHKAVKNKFVVFGKHGQKYGR